MKHDWIKSMGITVCIQCGKPKTKATDKQCKPKQNEDNS